MAGAYSQPPQRNGAGFTTDMPFQPLADCGAGNPFFYHSFFDDFDALAATAGFYTKTATGNGGIAHSAGDGGTIIFSTNNSTPAGTDIASIQLPAASFSLTAGRKLFYQVRLQLADLTNPAFIAGLIQTTTTPFTVTDGIYFSKASGSTTININSAVGSVITTVAIPTGAITNFAINTFFDLAFYVTRQGDVLAYADDQLVGFLPQAGTTANLTPPNAGPVARITAPSLTTANLNLTLALQSGTASAKSMIADFHSAQKER